MKKNVMIEKLEQGYNFSKKAGEAYEELITLLYSAKVEWKAISKTMIYKP